MKKLFFTLIVVTMALPGTAMAFDHSYKLWSRDFKEYQGNPLLFEHSAGSDKGVLRFAFNYLDHPTQDAVLAKQRWPWLVDYRPAHRSLNGGD